MAGERNEIGKRLTLDAEEMRVLGYARSIALSSGSPIPAYLLVVPFPGVDELARRLPAADAMLREAARERLAAGRR